MCLKNFDCYQRGKNEFKKIFKQVRNKKAKREVCSRKLHRCIQAPVLYLLTVRLLCTIIAHKP